MPAKEVCYIMGVGMVELHMTCTCCAGPAGAQHALPGISGQQLFHSIWRIAGSQQALC